MCKNYKNTYNYGACFALSFYPHWCKWVGHACVKLGWVMK